MHLYKLKFDSKETPKCQPTSNCKQDLPISQQNKKRIDKINLENIKTKIHASNWLNGTSIQLTSKESPFKK
jgi:hypothetical protein